MKAVPAGISDDDAERMAGLRASNALAEDLQDASAWPALGDEVSPPPATSIAQNGGPSSGAVPSKQVGLRKTVCIADVSHLYERLSYEQTLSRVPPKGGGA